MKPTQEQAVAWAKEVSGVEFPAGTAGVKIGMSPEHLESVAALAYEAGRKDENEACAQIAAYLLKLPENDISAMIRRRIEQCLT